MCVGQNHIVGSIGCDSQVQNADWEAKLTAFEAVVEDFNVRGQRDEVSHPGWVTPFKFCIECGAPLGDLSIRKLFQDR